MDVFLKHLNLSLRIHLLDKLLDKNCKNLFFLILCQHYVSKKFYRLNQNFKRKFLMKIKKNIFHKFKKTIQYFNNISL